MFSALNSHITISVFILINLIIILIKIEFNDIYSDK